MSQYELFEGATRTLMLNGHVLLSGLPPNVTLVDDPQGVGVFLRFAADKAASRHVFALGDLRCGPRLTFAHRYEPFWMRGAVGTKGGDVPPETQFLLCEWSGGNATNAQAGKAIIDGNDAAGFDEEDKGDADNEDNDGGDEYSEGDVYPPVVLFVPILDGDMRTSLQGTGKHGLELVGETGDLAVCASEITGLFIAVDTDVYRLMKQAAPSVMARMQTGRLGRDKPLPAWINDFGWCTWDAFYQEVSKDKVRMGLESFKRIGIQPRLIILDDGWQSVEKQPSGETRLTAFAANERFPGGLAPTVQMVKQEFGIKTFLVWHALHGYWGGVDGDALTGYEVRSVERRSSQGIVHHQPAVDRWWGPVVGVVSPTAIYRFYQDYHRHLRAQGVDGVKVDSQSTLESVSRGSGGRVSMMRHYHAALEGSVQVQFNNAEEGWQRGGSLINCMSCSSEMLYSALASTLTRTSTDFWPKLPASHGEHLYINALVSLWFGEFVHPDWDMFQSGHEMGAFHAMGRAVGGCPVYVSDKPDAHDADILRKLVFPDGTIARADNPGRPTRDCLFHDPTREDVLLKIFNRNGMVSQNGASSMGVIGVFNARYHAPPETPPVLNEQHGTVEVSDNAKAVDAETVDANIVDTEAANAAMLFDLEDAPAPEPPAVESAADFHATRGYVSPADAHDIQGERFVVYRHGTGEHRAMLRGERWEIELPQLTGDVFTISPIQDGFGPIGIADMYNSGGTIMYHGTWQRKGKAVFRNLWVRTSGRFFAWCDSPPTRVAMREAGGREADTVFQYDGDTHLLQVQVTHSGMTELIIEW